MNPRDQDTPAHPTAQKPLGRLMQEPYVAWSLTSFFFGVVACLLVILLDPTLLRAEVSPDGVSRKPVPYLAVVVAFAALSAALGSLTDSVGSKGPITRAPTVAFAGSAAVSILAAGWLALMVEVTIRFWFVAVSMAGLAVLIAMTFAVGFTSLVRGASEAVKRATVASGVAPAVWGLAGLLLALRALWSWFATAKDRLSDYGSPSWVAIAHHELLDSTLTLALGALGICIAARSLSRCRHPWMQLSAGAAFVAGCVLVLADAARWRVDHWSSDVATLAPGRVAAVLLVLASAVMGLAASGSSDARDRWASVAGGVLVSGAVLHGWYTDLGQPLVNLFLPGSGRSTMAYPIALGLGVLTLGLGRRGGNSPSTTMRWLAFAFPVGSAALVVGVSTGGLGINWRGNALSLAGALVVAMSTAAQLVQLWRSPESTER